jgi:hypothetical protein
MSKVLRQATLNRNRQKGAITMFSAVLILILLTEMILYAVQVGVFEQRKSSNEMQQKMSFHVADSGIQQAKQFISANADSVVDEWITEGRWQLCNPGTDVTNPCFGEPVEALRNDTYVYSFDPVNYPGGVCRPDNANELPLCWDELGAGADQQLVTHALLCMLNIDSDPLAESKIVSPKGCLRFDEEPDSRYFMITLLSRGESDCNGGNCGAETLIAEKVASFALGANEGGVGAPLTARTNVPLSGTVEIVPNPNGGGIGVPLSSWVNTNSTCDVESPTEPISPVSGSYATCEKHEWYGQDIEPVDLMCPTATCSCDPSKEKMITYATGNDRQMGIDIVPDDNFPCDLFMATFGMTWDALKQFANEQNRVLTDCDSLNEQSDGLYVVLGPVCDLKTQVGSKDNVVTLISAASDTRVSAQAEFFGVLMVTDKEDENANFSGNGTATIYGAAIMDAEMEHFNGTFQIVYVEELIDDALDYPLLGAIAGGWTDFHEDWR